MATAAYLAAAKQATAGKREPVICVRVEDVSTLEEFYTTKSDWDAAVVSVNMETVESSNDVFPKVVLSSFTLSDLAGPNYSRYNSVKFTTPNYPTFPLTMGGFQLNIPSAYIPTTANVVFSLRETNYTGAVVATTAPVSVLFTIYPIDINTLFKKAVVPELRFILASGNQLAANTEYCLTWDSPSDTSGQATHGLTTATGTLLLTPQDAANSTLTTATIDMGVTPASPCRFNVDDIKPAGTSITYTAYADDFDPPTTSRGVVEDGDEIGAAGYRYYRIKADFATTNGARAVLQEIRIADAQYQIFSTHKDLPSVGAKPLLPANPVGTLSSKIEIDKPTSVGELSFKLLWTKATGDMLATGYLRNKAIQIQHGFVGLAASDFETIFTGTWANYKADHVKRMIDVSTQNVLKKFVKVKLPRETVNETTWVKTTTPLTTETTGNAVQVILNLVEELGIPDRYLDRTTIEGLRDGALTSANYNVTRTISTPEEAWKLIHQLATLCGCFVVVLPTGKMSLVLYDASATPVDTLDARYCDFGTINGGQDQLFTRQLIYYAPNVTDPGESEGDYDNARLRINADSETAYGEVTEHRWFDQWGASTTVISALADRWNTWQGAPRFTLAVKKVGNHHIGILEGQIVWVKGLTVPVAAANFDTPQKFKALVTKRAFNPTNCTLDFELLQISDAEAA